MADNQSRHYDIIVIGTGPSAAAAVYQLLKSGIQDFAILDAAKELPPNLQMRMTSLKASLSHGENYLKRVRKQTRSHKSLSLDKHYGSKTFLGSDFAYANPSEITSFDCEIANFTQSRGSLAFGGLSNYWGGTFFPSHRLSENLIEQKHFDVISEIVPIIGKEDALTEHLPLPKSWSNFDVLTKFGEYIIGRYQKPHNKFSISKNGFKMGYPRIALETRGGNQSCQMCGSCNIGCIHGSIWNSSSFFSPLFTDKKATFFGGREVIEILPDEKTVRIRCAGGEQFSANKVFLGCGSLLSATLLAKSQLLPPTSFLHETQVSILPLFVPKKQEKEPRGFTLSQAFIYSIPKNGVHDFSVQLIGFSPELVDRVFELYPFLRILPECIVEFIMRFSGAALIYQPMDSSGQLRIEVTEGKIQITEHSESLQGVTQVNGWRSLIRSLRAIGLFPFVPLIQRTPIGSSYHLGRLVDSKGDFLINDAGQLIIEPRIFAIDGLALRDLAPGSITNTIMANAVRVVEKCVS
jgi:hypothetical protein